MTKKIISTLIKCKKLISVFMNFINKKDPALTGPLTLLIAFMLN